MLTGLANMLGREVTSFAAVCDIDPVKVMAWCGYMARLISQSGLSAGELTDLQLSICVLLMLHGMHVWCMQVCRRAERSVVPLVRAEAVDAEVRAGW
jgi:hypothetical protein